MADKEHEEAVQEWIEETVAEEDQVPLDQLISLYGYALLGLEEGDEALRLKKSKFDSVETLNVEAEKEEDYEYPNRRKVPVSSKRTVKRAL